MANMRAAVMLAFLAMPPLHAAVAEEVGGGILYAEPGPQSLGSATFRLASSTGDNTDLSGLYINKPYFEAQIATAFGRFEEAIDHYSRALEAGGLTREQLVTTFLERGDLLQAFGQIEDAIEDFRTVTILEPKNSKAHLSMGMANIRVGTLDVALEYLDRALETGQLDQNMLAWAYEARGFAYYLRVRPESLCVQT